MRLVSVASKTRMAPLGGQTIPRLELLGAVILAPSVKHIEAALSGTLFIVGWTPRQFSIGLLVRRNSGNSLCRTELWRSEALLVPHAGAIVPPRLTQPICLPEE